MDEIERAELEADLAELRQTITRHEEQVPVDLNRYLTYGRRLDEDERRLVRLLEEAK